MGVGSLALGHRHPCSLHPLLLLLLFLPALEAGVSLETLTTDLLWEAFLAQPIPTPESLRAGNFAPLGGCLLWSIACNGLAAGAGVRGEGPGSAPCSS